MSGKIIFTEKEKALIIKLNDPLYTVEYLEEWINRKDNVLANAPAALNAIGAKGFYKAVKQMVRTAK